MSREKVMLQLGLFQPSPCLSSFVASSISRRVPGLCRNCRNQTRVGESAYLQEERDECFISLQWNFCQWVCCLREGRATRCPRQRVKLREHGYQQLQGRTKRQKNFPLRSALLGIPEVSWVGWLQWGPRAIYYEQPSVLTSVLCLQTAYTINKVFQTPILSCLNVSIHLLVENKVRNQIAHLRLCRGLLQK